MCLHNIVVCCWRLLALLLVSFHYNKSSYDQLWAASLIGRNAVTWHSSLSNEERITVDGSTFKNLSIKQRDQILQEITDKWSVLCPLSVSLIYTVSQKKTRHQTLGHNFTKYYPIFKIFFTSRLSSKFATNSCLNIPPRFKLVATLPCEIWMQKNGIILKYVLQLMMNQWWITK